MAVGHKEPLHDEGLDANEFPYDIFVDVWWPCPQHDSPQRARVLDAAADRDGPSVQSVCVRDRVWHARLTTDTAARGWHARPRAWLDTTAGRDGSRLTEIADGRFAFGEIEVKVLSHVELIQKEFKVRSKVAREHRLHRRVVSTAPSSVLP